MMYFKEDYKKMKIERIFNEESNVKFEEILNSLLAELIDTCIEDYYNASNHTTSFEKGDVEK